MGMGELAPLVRHVFVRAVLLLLSELIPDVSLVRFTSWDVAILWSDDPTILLLLLLLFLLLFLLFYDCYSCC